MSEENVQVVQAIYERVLAKGRMFDPATFEQVRELFDPDIELQQMDRLVGTTGTFHGYEGMLSFVRELFEAFEDLHVVPERHFDGNNDSVVTIARGRAKGRGSGVEVDMVTGQLWVLRLGRVVRWVNYATPEEAFEAVGLRN